MEPNKGPGAVKRRGVIIPPAQPMEILRVNPPTTIGSRTVGTIAMCCRDSVKAPTVTSMITQDYTFLGPNENVGRFIITGNLLTMQRNECVNQMDGDWILFIDDDMVWQPSAVTKILQTQKDTGADVVGGLCFQRTSPHQPTLYFQKEGGYTFLERWDDGEILDVDATGLAFCLITVQALTKIVRHVTDDPTAVFPSLETRKRLGAPPNFFQWDGRWGEDFAFCREAKAAGCRIIVDTGIEIGHVSELIVNKKSFLRELAFRSDPILEAKRVLNETVGIETMSREEAMTRLWEIQHREDQQ